MEMPAPHECSCDANTEYLGASKFRAGVVEFKIGT